MNLVCFSLIPSSPSNSLYVARELIRLRLSFSVKSSKPFMEETKLFAASNDLKCLEFFTSHSDEILRALFVRDPRSS